MRIILSYPISSHEISRAVSGREKAVSDFTVTAIVTDSREAKSGDLFVALKGEDNSGERYIKDAQKSGAYTLSAENEYADFKVSNTSVALLKLASYYKTKFKNLKMTIAITGSVGKTTTKNIVTKLLSEKFRVHKTHENFNNFLGVAHTLFTMPEDTEILVAEIGMNHAGEISLLSKALSPDVAIITNIGNAHIGNLGSRASIAKAKLEISDGMKRNIIILPYDEPLLQSVSDKITFSLSHSDADCFLKTKSENAEFTVADVHLGNRTLLSKKIAMPGKHILSAVAIGVLTLDLMGFNNKEISTALDMLGNESTRGKIKKVANLTFLDDTYSSSPEALIANFELMSLYRPKKISCVLGDMLELGEESEKLHRYIGQKVSEYGFDKLFTFGKSASYIAEGALASGMEKGKIYENPDFNSPEITAKQIYTACSADEIILCKASHSIRAYRIYELIENLFEREDFKNA